MSKTNRFHLTLPERQFGALSHLSEIVQLSVPQIVRSMVERSLCEEQLNHLYPSMSGQLRTETK